jgi:hypothetical protein
MPCTGAPDKADRRRLTKAVRTLNRQKRQRSSRHPKQIVSECHNLPIGAPVGAWGPADEPLPGAATLIGIDEMTKLGSEGELIPLTKDKLLKDQRAREERRASDRETIDAFLAQYPERASKLRRQATSPEAIPTSDGNFHVDIRDNTGGTFTVTTQGRDARDGSIAGAIRHFSTFDNQSIIYRAIYPRVSETCTAGLPDPTNLAAVSPERLRLLNKQISRCWWNSSGFLGPPGRTSAAAALDAQAASLAASGQSATRSYAGDGSNGPACEHAPDGLFNSLSWSGKAYDSPIKSQGRRGSCVAFGLVAAMENASARMHDTPINISEQALYAEGKLSVFPDDYSDGLPLDDFTEELQDRHFAVPPEGVWPYNDSRYREDQGFFLYSCSSPDGSDTYDGPACSETTHQAKIVCAIVSAPFVVCGYWTPVSPGSSGYGIDSFVEVDDLTDDDLSTAALMVTAGYSVVAAVDVTKGFTAPRPSGVVPIGVDDEEDVVGGHAMQLSGWIWNSQLPPWVSNGSGGGYFVVKNSWGCNNGDGGYYFLTADWLSEHIQSAVALYPGRLGTNQPPAIRIDSPQNGTTYLYGGVLNGTVELKAHASDLEDGDDCCRIVWTSSKDGYLGVGASVTRSFDWLGERTITATATDSEGKSASSSVTINVANEPPGVRIVKPGNHVLYRNVAYGFEGTVHDSNELDLTCDGAVWTSSAPTDPFPKTGCGFVVSFATTGFRTITLSATDHALATSHDEFLVLVVDAPKHEPPVVAITSPRDGAFIEDPKQPLQLNASVQDPDGGAYVAYRWSVQPLHGTEIDIGDTLDLSWVPDTTLGFKCGGWDVTLRLYATDADGTTMDSVRIYVFYPTC